MNIHYYYKPKKLYPVYVIMLIGCLTVFTGLIAINKGSTRISEDVSATLVNFIVPTKPSAPPPPKPKQEKRVKRDKRPALAPVPRLDSSLSSISLSSPDFLTSDASSVSQSLLGDLENVVMTEDVVDTPPIPKSIEWEYPQRAKQREVEGTVVVALHISDQGVVIQAEIIEADPSGVFDEAILNAAKSWRFIPAKYENKPVAAWVNLPIEAKLN